MTVSFIIIIPRSGGQRFSHHQILRRALVCSFDGGDVIWLAGKCRSGRVGLAIMGWRELASATKHTSPTSIGGLPSTPLAFACSCGQRCRLFSASTQPADEAIEDSGTSSKVWCMHPLGYAITYTFPSSLAADVTNDGRCPARCPLHQQCAHIHSTRASAEHMPRMQPLSDGHERCPTRRSASVPSSPSCKVHRPGSKLSTRLLEPPSTMACLSASIAC